MNTQQELVIELLARGVTAKETAAQTSASPRSIRRWKKEPEFAAELRAAVTEYRDNLIFSMDAVVRRARAEEKLAFDRTRELMHGDSAVDANRACNLAHNTALKWMKFIVRLSEAETSRDIGAMTSALAKAYPETEAPGPQASSLTGESEEKDECSIAGLSSSANANECAAGGLSTSAVAEGTVVQPATPSVTSTVSQPERGEPDRVAPIAPPSGSRSDLTPREEIANQTSTATPDPVSPSPSPSTGRGLGGGVTPPSGFPGPENYSESGQKRPPKTPAPIAQTEATETVDSNLTPQIAVAASSASARHKQPHPSEKIDPAPVAQASSLRVAPPSQTEETRRQDAGATAGP